MSLVMGIVGLPNVGKSSLFNALTKGDALVENRPFATIEPNLGVVKLSDTRLDKLSELIKPQKTTHSTVKFLDIAGLVKGASQGEGLGNKFLENIRGVDAICLVVRAFNNKDIFSVVNSASADPVFEAEIVLCELVYSDLDMVVNILKKLKSNDPRTDVLNRLKKHLENNQLVLNFELTEKEKELLKIYSFLTDKSLIVLANTDDSQASKDMLVKVEEYSRTIGASFMDMNIKLENEISDLSEEEQEEFLSSVGRKERCLDKLVSLAFKKLGLSTFFTAGEKEVKSWTFKTGSTARECAGLIHSDIKKNFIKAKVAKYADFVNFCDFKTLKQSGKLAIEGKDYIVEDGDIIYFEFNN